MKPRSLTYLETMQETLRALLRLKVKQLICGPTYYNGLCCAWGAYRVHASSLKKVEVDNSGTPGKFRLEECPPGWGSLINENESFRPGKNDVLSRRLRYRHVFNFVVDKITEQTGKRPELADRYNGISGHAIRS